MLPSTLRVLSVASLIATPLAAQAFTDVTSACGLERMYVPMPNSFPAQIMTSGIAVSDYDNDGWDDVFFTGGHLGGTALFRNEGNGSFREITSEAGLDLHIPGGQPLFFDADNDGDLDLFITAYERTGPAMALVKPNGTTSTMYMPGGLSTNPDDIGLFSQRNWFFTNNGDGTFTDTSVESGLMEGGRWGAAAGDLNGDGALDVVTVSWSAHGGTDGLTKAHISWNDGNGHFRHRTPLNIDATITAGFAPHIWDMDDDGDDDLFWAGDFLSSKYFRNDGNSKFTDVTAQVGYGTDENGMGCCVFDYDNDNDFDIFVSAIYSDYDFVQGSWGTSGNRLYQNDGNAVFTDATDAAGVRNGDWGWGADYGDIDNDGDFDLLHTNGFYSPPDDHPEFNTDPMRAFLNDGRGNFTESAAAIGLTDTAQGRGLVLFDFDRDGALDVVISNHDTGLRMYKGDPATVAQNWLTVKLEGTTSNHFGIGAKVWLQYNGQRRLDKIEAGSNFMSQSPPSARFGLGHWADPVGVRVEWPNGQVQIVEDIAVNQVITITQP